MTISDEMWAALMRKPWGTVVVVQIPPRHAMSTTVGLAFRLARAPKPPPDHA